MLSFSWELQSCEDLYPELLMAIVIKVEKFCLKMKLFQRKQKDEKGTFQPIDPTQPEVQKNSCPIIFRLYLG